MSAKPTPGPYTTVWTNQQQWSGLVLLGGDVTIGHLFGRDGTPEANARAFVDGIAAIETLEQIRRILRDEPLLPNERLQAIDAILDEAKP